MEALTFFSAMNRGQFREEQGIEGSSYCCLLYTSDAADE